MKGEIKRGLKSIQIDPLIRRGGIALSRNKEERWQIKNVMR
jgi:hypothetical protein